MAQIGWTTTLGPPPDQVGAQGDMNWDPQGRFAWGPKGATSWAGTANGLTGMNGPPGIVGAQPPMQSLAPTYGPSVQFGGQTMGTVAQAANSVFFFMGSSIPNTFTPAFNSALSGIQVTNYGASNATIYFYLQDLTTNSAVFGYNSGNGIAAGTVASQNFAATTYPLLAGHTYQWQGIRGSAGASYIQINPLYLMPANIPSSISIYQPFLVTTAQSVAKNGTINTACPNMNGNQAYYRNSNPSWLHSLELFVAGSGNIDPYFTNTSASNANQFTADNYGYPTLSSTPQRFLFGPFSPQTWPFIANNVYTLNMYAISGTLSITSLYATLTVGQ